MTMKREPSISEQQAREIVERMGRRESRSEKSMDDFTGLLLTDTWFSFHCHKTD